jgi:riboflavin kinase
MNRGILILYEISRRMKSGGESISISSSELGVSLGISQQTASRYLLDLEKNGLIARKISNEGQEISLTTEGTNFLHEFYSNLKEFFNGGRDVKDLSFDGIVISGIGEGAYYIKEYEDRIKEIFGFKPFPGTLNLKIKENRNLERHSKGIIKGFRKGERTFGDVKFMPVRIAFKGKSKDSYLIFPKRTHHKDVVEIISDSNLRKALGLKDRDTIKIELIS